MEKKLLRIISPSQAMSEYPEITLTTFDHRVLPHLSLVVINGLPRGLDRTELEQKRQRFRYHHPKLKK